MARVVSWEGVRVSTTLARRLLAVPQAAAGGGGFIIEDTFTEGSDTALGSHTPDTDTEGGGWTEENGTWTVRESGDFVNCSDTSHAVASIDAGVEDQEVTATITYDRGGGTFRWQGLMVRGDGAGSYLGFRVNGNVGGDADLILDGSVLHTWSSAFSPGISDLDVIKTRFTALGNDITVSFPDGEYSDLTYELTGGDATSHGVGCGHTHVGLYKFRGDTGEKWDDFEVIEAS